MKAFYNSRNINKKLKYFNKYTYIFFAFFIDTEFLLWLENTKPWIKIVQLWEKTSKIRLKSLQSGTQSIQNYIKLYPVLEEPQRYTLVRR